MGMANRETNENELFELMAKKLNIDKENILDYELYLYPVDKGQLVGINADFIVTPRQDDLIMVYAASEALINSPANDTTKMIAFSMPKKKPIRHKEEPTHLSSEIR